MTDLATALRHELDRLPRHDRARFVHADRLEPLLTAHDDQIDRLVRMAAVARGVPDDVIRLEVGLPSCGPPHLPDPARLETDDDPRPWRDHHVGQREDRPDGPVRSLLGWEADQHEDARGEDHRRDDAVGHGSAPLALEPAGVEHLPETAPGAAAQVQREGSVVRQGRELQLGSSGPSGPLLPDTSVLRHADDDAGESDEHAKEFPHARPHRPTGARHER